MIQPPKLRVKLEVFTVGVANLKVGGGKIVVSNVECIYCYWIDEVLDFCC